MKLNIDFGPNLHVRTIDFERLDYFELSTSVGPKWIVEVMSWPEVDEPN